eukprot:7381954-Prymnesium_polylepis.1
MNWQRATAARSLRTGPTCIMQWSTEVQRANDDASNEQYLLGSHDARAAGIGTTRAHSSLLARVA